MQELLFNLFGFYWGSEIPDPEKILIGKGNQYRYILVKNKKDFPKTYIKKLVKDGSARRRRSRAATARSKWSGLTPARR